MLNKGKDTVLSALLQFLCEFDDFVNPRGSLAFSHSCSLMKYSNLTKHTGSVSGIYTSFCAEDTDWIVTND